MKLKELRDYFETIKDKVSDDTEIIVIPTVDSKFQLKSFVDDIKVFSDTDSEGNWLNPYIAVACSVNVMGTVDTLNLVNDLKKEAVNDIIKMAEKKNEFEPDVAEEETK